MTTHSEGSQEVEAYSLVWGEGGVLFRVPQPVVEPYRLSAAQWAEIESSLTGPDSAGAAENALPEGAEFIRAIPEEILAPFEVKGEDVRGYDQFIGTFPNTVAVKKPTGVGGMRATYMVSIAEGRALLGDYHPPLH